MEAVLIGYFPKRTVPRPEWLQAPQVLEICSASCCISEAPDGWINQWRHNEQWLYDSPALALSLVPQEVREQWDLYAFARYPIVFDEGEVMDDPILAEGVEPLPDDFEFLGFDAVSCSTGNSLECSPLSCNGVAEEWPTNQFCLFDSLEAALDGAKKFSRSEIGCEPGPYCVVKVYRQKGSS